jgi:hypothetical protein
VKTLEIRMSATVVVEDNYFPGKHGSTSKTGLERNLGQRINTMLNQLGCLVDQLHLQVSGE